MRDEGSSRRGEVTDARRIDDPRMRNWIRSVLKEARLSTTRKPFCVNCFDCCPERFYMIEYHSDDSVMLMDIIIRPLLATSSLCLINKVWQLREWDMQWHSVQWHMWKCPASYVENGYKIWISIIKRVNIEFSYLQFMLLESSCLYRWRENIMILVLST